MEELNSNNREIPITSSSSSNTLNAFASSMLGGATTNPQTSDPMKDILGSLFQALRDTSTAPSRRAETSRAEPDPQSPPDPESPFESEPESEHDFFHQRPKSKSEYVDEKKTDQPTPTEFGKLAENLVGLLPTLLSTATYNKPKPGIFHDLQVKNIHHAFAMVLESNHADKFIRIMNERQQPVTQCSARYLLSLFVVLFPEIPKERKQKLATLVSIAIDMSHL